MNAGERRDAAGLRMQEIAKHDQSRCARALDDSRQPCEIGGGRATRHRGTPPARNAAALPR